MMITKTQTPANQAEFILNHRGFSVISAPMDSNHIYGTRGEDENFERVDVRVTPAGNFVVTVFKTHNLNLVDEQYVDGPVKIAQFLATALHPLSQKTV